MDSNSYYKVIISDNIYLITPFQLLVRAENMGDVYNIAHKAYSGYMVKSIEVTKYNDYLENQKQER